MKALRIVQLLLLLLVGAYLVLLHSANPTNLVLPFLVALPPALVLVVALLAGWWLGWLPAQFRLWARERELRRLRRRVEELEQHVPSYDTPQPQRPIIPDRSPATGEEAYSSHENL